MRRKIKKAFFFLLGSVLAVCLMEGIVSLGFTFLEFAASPILAEKRHARYDPELGWANIAGVKIKDMYGLGKDLSINSQGFRALVEYPGQAPPGKIRVICLGDSFIMGFGAPDQGTIPAYLSAMDQNLEAVNMGQGAYGLDQMYLWYKRERDKLDHDVLAVSFIDEDVARMSWKVFSGYDKPFLKLENGVLRVKNVPIPRSGFGLGRSLDDLLQGSALHRLVRALLKGVFGSRQFGAVYDTNQEFLDTAVAVFEDLRAWTRDHGITLVVWRPVQQREAIAPLVEKLGEELQGRGFNYFDLNQDATGMPKDMRDSLFISRQNADPVLLGYLTFEGHYTDMGNRVAAAMLVKKLTENHLLKKRGPGPAKDLPKGGKG